MNTLEDSFTKLLGQQPTDVQKQALLRAREALDLRNNDALWLLLMALGHYETLYARFPALISRAATEVTEKVKTAADAELKAAVARTRAELAKSLALTAHEIASRVANARRWQSAAAALVAATIAFAGIGAAMFRAGRTSGMATGQHEGYERARDENAAAAWANTPEGQLGYALAKAGNLRDLASCTGKVFVRRGATCFVKAGQELTVGWKLAP